MPGAIGMDAANAGVRPASRWRRTTSALLLCIAGAALSGELLKREVGPIWPGATRHIGLAEALCDAGRQVGLTCDGAGAELRWQLLIWSPSSSWHWMPIAVPLSFIGLAYFIALGTWLLGVGLPGRMRNWDLVPLLLTAGGGAVSTVLLAHLLTRASSACVLCLSTHVINLFLALLLYTGVRFGAAHWPRVVAVARRRAVLASVCSAVLLITVLWEHYSLSVAVQHETLRLEPSHAFVQTLKKDAGFLLREFDAQDKSTSLAGASSSRGGRIVVFSDLTCRACRCQWRRLREWTAPALAAGMELEIRHFPLTSECNAFVERPGGDRACSQAYLAAAVRLQMPDAGEYLAFLDWLYEQRAAGGTPDRGELAERFGLNSAELEGDLAGATVRETVAADVELGHALGVTGTPTIFVQGRRLPDICNTPAFWNALATRAGGAPATVAAKDAVRP